VQTFKTRLRQESQDREFAQMRRYPLTNPWVLSEKSQETATDNEKIEELLDLGAARLPRDYRK
jgi:hypothetical protein